MNRLRIEGYIRNKPFLSKSIPVPERSDDQREERSRRTGISDTPLFDCGLYIRSVLRSETGRILQYTVITLQLPNENANVENLGSRRH